MKNEILINVSPEQTRVAVFEDGVLHELHLQYSLKRGLLGNIYMGKVVRVLPGMQAAFVDIGLENNGFLHARDVRSENTISRDLKSGETMSIQSLLREGQTVMVQVSKQPRGDKGAGLTMNIALPSRHLVFLPYSNGVGVSNKIVDQQARNRLKDFLEKLIADGAINGGIIVRTFAESANDQELIADIRYLQQLWKKISSAKKNQSKGSPIHQDMPLELSAVRDFADPKTSKILFDSNNAYSQAKNFIAEFMPKIEAKIELHSKSTPLFSEYEVEQEITHALERKVELVSGGSIFIDQSEAMTTIDVNSGSDVGFDDDQDTFIRTNLAAAIEIARQIRLRNLGGMIIIDFIDMRAARHKKQVLLALQSALARDRVKIGVSGMSSLGLVEITRQRSRESLDQLLCEPCAVCNGRGLVKTVRTVCYEILYELNREDSQFKANFYTVVANSLVVDALQNELARSLAHFEKLVQRPIKLQVDTSFSQQQFDIVLN